MNLGQLALEVERIAGSGAADGSQELPMASASKVTRLGKVNGRALQAPISQAHGGERC